MSIATIARRDLLRLGVSGAALAVVGRAAVGPAEAQTTSVVRSDVSLMGDTHPTIVTFRAAVKYMKSLPSSDVRSWAYQTSIHYNYCPHGNWYFLPWHREYTRAFEKIIQSFATDPKAAPLVPGAASFALPYWDWTRNPRQPATFTSPTLSDGSPNPLYDATRQAAPSATVPTEFTGKPVMDNVYSQTKFESFASSRPKGQKSLGSTWQRRSGTYGPLESTAHNNVHNWIGGDMATMLSPTDPFFWLHHCNIDRIWASWNAMGNANTTNKYWTNFTFTNNFARPTGALYSIRVRDISMSGYSYDRLDPRPGTTAQMLLPESEWVEVADAAAGAAGVVPVAGSLTGRFRAANGKAARLGAPLSVAVNLQGRAAQLGPRAALRLLDLPAPTVSNAPYVRVFVNHPAIGADTPPTGPYYVGTFSFFGTAAEHSAMQMGGGAARFSFELPLTNALAAQRRLGRPLADTLTVQVVPAAIGRTAQQAAIQPALVEVEFSS